VCSSDLFNSGSGGSISNAVVRYAGSSSLGLGAVYIATNNASPTISNSMITDNQQWGIQLSNSGTNPAISGNTFSRNPTGILVGGGAPAISGNTFDNYSVGVSASSGASAITNNTFNGSGSAVPIQIDPTFVGTISGSVVNGGVKAVDVRSGTVSGNVTWAETGLPYRINCNVSVQSGATLTIAPNVVVKFQNASSNCLTYLSISGGSLVANGTSSQPIYFTSLVDDAVGGDTNGDGNATTPAAGLWGGIFFNSAVAVQSPMRSSAMPAAASASERSTSPRTTLRPRSATA